MLIKSITNKFTLHKFVLAFHNVGHFGFHFQFISGGELFDYIVSRERLSVSIIIWPPITFACGACFSAPTRLVCSFTLISANALNVDFISSFLWSHLSKVHYYRLNVYCIFSGKRVPQFIPSDRLSSCICPFKRTGSQRSETRM